MSSQHQDEKSKAEQEMDKHYGWKMCGYVIPWWVIIVIVLIVLWLIYDKSNQVKKIFVNTSAPTMTGGAFDSIDLETPRAIRELFH